MVCALVALVGACARQGAPPGGPEDRRPPVVVSTTPDTFEIVTDFDGRVRFDFDERISERVQGGSLDGAVVVSPQTGAPRVRHERQSLIVELDGGFKPGIVYRVTLQPVVSDLFNSVMRDPFELVFSTGPQPEPTTIAGIVWDRITGRGAADYQVRALRVDPQTGVEDSLRHIARTDTGGVFAFRYVPGGRYALTAYEDRNRNGEPDLMEPQGSFRLLIQPRDTMFAADIPILQPDTTPARVTSVEPLDSVTLLVEFDDYLEPDLPLAGVGVSLMREDDSTLVSPARIFHAHEYLTYAQGVADSLAVLDSLDALARERDRRVADSIAALTADTVSADSAAAAPDVPGDSVAAPPQVGSGPPVRRRLPPGLDGRPVQRARPPAAGQQPARTPTGPNGERLPSREIVVVLPDFLRPNVGYRLTVTAVRNLFGVPLGGGEAVVVIEPPPEDTTAVSSDTTGVARDTSVVDTARAGAVVDTGSVVTPFPARPRERARRR